MTLYRYNLRVSQEIFTIISCFEVALRNRIDNQLKVGLGADWLRDSVLPNGIFTGKKTLRMYDAINKEYQSLCSQNDYSHTNLLSKLSFGTWKSMFGDTQYLATGQCLLSIFPNKPKSSPAQSFNSRYVYNELDNINNIRNRIAHHEPICFDKSKSSISTQYIRDKYNQIMTLFQWMDIDAPSLLYGLDHVISTCDKIDGLK